MPDVLVFLIFVVVIILAVALVLALALGVGWLLTLFLPLSLFEGALLSMLAGWIIGSIIVPFFGKVASETPDIFADEDYREIPEDRFWDEEEQPTWENFLHYTFANAIYEDVADTEGWVGNLDDVQQQELSIRLADAAIAAIKHKSPRARNLRVTTQALQRALEAEGQRPYEDEVLDMAAMAVNLDIAAMEAVLRDIMAKEMWDDLADESIHFF